MQRWVLPELTDPPESSGNLGCILTRYQFDSSILINTSIFAGISKSNCLLFCIFSSLRHQKVHPTSHQYRLQLKRIFFYVFNCTIFQLQNNQSVLSVLTMQEQFGITETQLAKIQEVYKERNKAVQQRKSMNKRGSMKIKNLHRQSSLVNNQEMGGFEHLALYFENIDKHMQQIDQFCDKKRINFLKELKCKMSSQQYKSFLSTMQLYRLPQGGKLQEEGKPHNYHYIIVEGSIAAFHDKKTKQEQRQFLQMFEYETGEAILSNLLQTHKANPYTIKSKKSSLLLRFNEEAFNKYLKKIWMKQMDELATLLAHTLVFKAIPVTEIKKFLPYCSIRRFRYNQLIYDQGYLIRQLFLILDGQVEISYDREDLNRNKASKTMLAPIVPQNFYRMNHQGNERKEIKIVRVGKKQLFGLEAYEVFNENYYEHHARVTSDGLKTLAIGLDVLYQMEIENPILEENLSMYLKKINQIHNRLLQKSQNITFNMAPQKKKKKKRKLRKKNQNSLEWWGLAAKLQDSKKYRLPTPPKKSESAKHLTRKDPLQIAHRVSKIDYFKRRLFQDEMQALDEINQKQNTSSPSGLVPKLQKMKIKMINTQPKVINNAERVKRKLLDYAKNGEVFCDKLQLE